MVIPVPSTVLYALIPLSHMWVLEDNWLRYDTRIDRRAGLLMALAVYYRRLGCNLSVQFTLQFIHVMSCNQHRNAWSGTSYTELVLKGKACWAK